MGRRLETFLYSRRNIVGSALAIAGLALHFVGIVAGPIWLPITIGLYAIGYLLVPADRGLELEMGAAQDAAEVKTGLNRLLRAIRGRVADDLYAKVVAIRDSIVGSLDVEGGEDGADPNVYLIRQTALAYLPDAFATYLKLPRVLAERRAIADGRTPHDVLLEQLDLMDRRLADVADDIARHDSDKLLANGRFLAEKFGVSSFRLDGTSAAPTEPSRSTIAEAPASTAPAGDSIGAPETAATPQHLHTAVDQGVTERERVH